MKKYHILIFILFVYVTDSYSQIDTTKAINENDIKKEYLNLKINENTDLFYNVENSTVSKVINDNSISESKVVVYKGKEYSENDYKIFIDNNSDSTKHPLILGKEFILKFFSKENSSNKLYITTKKL